MIRINHFDILLKIEFIRSLYNDVDDKCWYGEIGRHIGFKSRCLQGVWVRVPLPAPNHNLICELKCKHTGFEVSKDADNCQTIYNVH